MGDGLAGGLQRLLPLADVAEAVAEVVQRHGQVGEVGGGVGLGELPR